MRRFIQILATAALVVMAGAASAEQNTTPPDISVGTCIEHGGTVEQPPGSAIRACCLDGIVARGCYICDFKWENCTWDPAYGSRTQDAAPFGGAGGQTLSPDAATGGGPKPGVVDQVLAPLSTQPQMEILQPQPGANGGKDGVPAIKKKLQVVKPVTLLDPVALECLISNTASITTVYVVMESEIAVPAGRQIAWRTASGNQGSYTLTDELYPGKRMRVGRAPGAPSCSAWVVGVQPPLSQ